MYSLIKGSMRFLFPVVLAALVFAACDNPVSGTGGGGSGGGAAQNPTVSIGPAAVVYYIKDYGGEILLEATAAGGEGDPGLQWTLKEVSGERKSGTKLEPKGDRIAILTIASTETEDFTVQVSAWGNAKSEEIKIYGKDSSLIVATSISVNSLEVTHRRHDRDANHYANGELTNAANILPIDILAKIKFLASPGSSTEVQGALCIPSGSISAGANFATTANVNNGAAASPDSKIKVSIPPTGTRAEKEVSIEIWDLDTRIARAGSGTTLEVYTAETLDNTPSLNKAIRLVSNNNSQRVITAVPGSAYNSITGYTSVNLAIVETGILNLGNGITLTCNNDGVYVGERAKIELHGTGKINGSGNRIILNSANKSTHAQIGIGNDWNIPETIKLIFRGNTTDGSQVSSDAFWLYRPVLVGNIVVNKFNLENFIGTSGAGLNISNYVIDSDGVLQSRAQ